MANKSKIAYNISYSGIAVALSIVVMFVALIPAMTYVTPAFSGIIIWTICEQTNKKWAFLAYAAASLLIFLLIPEMESKIYFILFFGYYPIIRDFIEKIKPKFLSWIAKFGIFNAAIILSYNIVAPIVGADKFIEELEFLGDMALLGCLVVANIAFICYEVCLSSMMYAFKKWLKPRLKKK